MSVFDLHPEELLDREASGELLDHERAMLDAHLHHCVSCRLERQVRKDFALELDAELPSHTGALVTRALESQKPAAPAIADQPEKQAPNAPEMTHDEHVEEQPARIPSQRARAMRRRVSAAVFAAAVLMLASVAVAARGSRVWTAIFAPAPVDVEESVAASPAPVAPKKRAHHHATPTNANNDTNAAPTDDSSEPNEPKEVVAPVETPAPVTASPTACAPVPQPLAPQAPRVIPRVEDAPAAVFQDANSARRRGDHVAAARLYRDLIEKHGASAEAPAARIALGRMLLDDGDADAALMLFRDYLTNGDAPLREEAMDGRARALERTHRADEERAAWNDLLASYPESVHKAHAEARLLDLTKH